MPSLDFKTSGKPVYAFLEYGGDREYYLATAADKIFLVPTATLDLTGVATYEVFLRGTLDWIGTYPDFLHIGDYKTAINLFTEKTFTPAHKEMSASLNRDQFDQLVRAIADGRRKTRGRGAHGHRRGPAPARGRAAPRAGRRSRVRRRARRSGRRTSAAPASCSCVESDDYAASPGSRSACAAAARSPCSTPSAPSRCGRSGYDPVNGAVVGSDSIVEYIREIRADSSIRAIVLRIDSPGGASTASDVIWRELMITKNDARKRPIIVSMSDLAASGGYYIAMAGDVHRRAAGHAHRIDRHLHRQVRHRRHVREARREHRGDQRRPPRRDLLARSALHRRGARQGAGVDAGLLRSVRREGRRGAAHDAGEDRSDRAGPGVDRPAGASRSGWSTSSAACRTAVAVAKQRARIPAEEEVELVVYPPRRSFYEVLSEQFDQPPAAAIDGRSRSCRCSARAIARSSPRSSRRHGCSARARSSRTCRTCSFAERQVTKSQCSRSCTRRCVFGIRVSRACAYWAPSGSGRPRAAADRPRAAAFPD